MTDDMTYGFPRPRKHVKKIKVKGQGSWKNYDWSAWDDKTYPVPYTAKLARVGEMSYTRTNECVAKRLCIVCGILVEDKRPWAYVWNNSFPKDAGPFHQKCVTLTKTMCPVVAVSTGEFVFMRTSWRALENRVVPDYQRDDWQEIKSHRKVRLK